MSKTKRKSKNKVNQNHVIELNQHEAFKKKQNVNIIPRNTKQEEYFDYLNDNSKRIVFALGPAGTGKTLLATLQAIKLFKEKKITKIIITRPAIEVAGEKHGFLPGDLNNKMEPWTRPIFDIIAEYFNTKEIKMMLEEKVIEVAPLAYLRGRTFKDSVVILDEAQNTTTSQMKMVLTRIGEGTRMFVTGDIQQTDIRSINGLEDFTQKLIFTGSSKISYCEFERDHIERDSIVTEVLGIYGED